MNRLVIPSLLVFAVACGTDDDRPTDHAYAKTTNLVQYATCNALETDLKQMLIHEAWADIDRADKNWGYGIEGDAAGGSGAGAGASGGGRQEGVDYSGTNNQEQGVDEADLVKTDGYHIYNLNGNRLHIFGVPQFGQLVPESVTQLEGHPTQMLVDKTANRAVVFSMINVDALPVGHPLRALVGYSNDYSGWYWRSRTLTKITVLDITDRTLPTLVREVYFEGWYQTARKVNTSVRVATYAMIDRPEIYDWWRVYNDSGRDKDVTKRYVTSRINRLSLADLIPQMYVRTPNGKFTSNSLSTQSCRSFYRPTDSHARGISSIISFDLLGSELAWDADHVVSNYPTIYASQNTLIVAESAHDWWWYWWFTDDADQLNIHAFDISTPGQSHYIGSGRVDGQIVDQFSLDEQDGVIRIATTTGNFWRWWAEKPPTPENHVWVLEETGRSLVQVGHVGGIAKGERLMTSRFLGDKGYLVTYHQVDPLFTVDLRDRTNPKIVGELKVPGFSTYLNPMGPTGLLSIGIDNTGGRWRTNISMFDIGDFAHPQLTQSLALPATQGWSWSQALWEHKAFQYWAPKKLLAIPESNYESSGGYWRYLSRLQLITVDPGVGLSLHGSIDHTSYYQEDQSHWWSFVDIKRSIFMGDFVYAISDKAITAHRVTDLGLVAEQRLPGYKAGETWWWW